APAAKTHAPGLAHTHPVEGAIGSACQGLRQHRIHVVSNPRAVQAFGCLVQVVLGKPRLLAQRPKGALALEFLGGRNGPGPRPGRVSSHAREPPLPLREDRVIELSRRVLLGTQTPGLTSRDPEWELQEERWRGFAFLFCLFVRWLLVFL